MSNYVQKKLYRVPGPFTRCISSWPRIVSVNSGNSHDDDIALHRKYGPMVRIAPNTVSISDVAAIPTLYGIGTRFYKSPFYSLARTHDEEGCIPDPFILTDKAMHTRMKKNAANAYSLNGLVKMEAWIEPVTDRLFRLLDQHAESQNIVDAAPILANYAHGTLSFLSHSGKMWII